MASADSQMDAALNEVHNHDEKVKAKAAGKDKGKDKRSHGNLPTAFDWRNVNGVNFMLPAVNQVCRGIPRVTPREIPRRMGYRAGWIPLGYRWDTVPRGIPCRMGYRAAWDTVPDGIPCRATAARATPSPSRT